MSSIDHALDALKDRVRGVFELTAVNGAMGGGNQFPHARVYMGSGSTSRMDLSRETGFSTLTTDLIVEIHFSEEKYRETESSAHAALEQFMNELTESPNLNGAVQRINTPITHAFTRLVSDGYPIAYGYTFTVPVVINLKKTVC